MAALARWTSRRLSSVFGATSVSFERRFTGRGYRGADVPALTALDQAAVARAVSPEQAIERVCDGLLRFHRGEWAMPPRVYLENPPFGDRRAMPTRGERLALLKWVKSFSEPGARSPDGHGHDLTFGRHLG